MEMSLRVLGARHFKDTIEGKAHDFTKVRLEVSVPRNSTAEIGTNVVEAGYGDASRFADLKKLKFPCMCIVDLEPSSKGYDVIGDIRPVKGPEGAKAS